MLFRKSEHILENQVIFFFKCLKSESQLNHRAWCRFYFHWPLSHFKSPHFNKLVKCKAIILFLWKNLTFHVNSGYVHQIWTVFCVSGLFRFFQDYCFVPAFKIAPCVLGCDHPFDVFCRYVLAAVLKEARAVVGAMIIGRVWKRGTIFKAF